MGDGSVVRGQVGRLTTRYAVDWRWIVLHCVVNLGGIGFAAWTLVRSWMEGGRVPVWGSHSLAVLSRGEGVGELFAGAESVDEMEKRARPARIRLVDGGGPGNRVHEHGERGTEMEVRGGYERIESL